MSIIGDRIKDMRKSRGLTQIALAQSVNIANSVLAEIEAGRRTPSKELAKRLSLFFHEPIENFLLDDVSELANTKNINMNDILLIADIVQEFLNKNGYQITPEQRAQLVDHFYQQNITDASKINEMLAFMQSMNQNMFIKGK